MSGKENLIRRARQITARDRMIKLMSLQEPELHKSLEKLFSEIHKDATVIVTHSPQELGADLVVITKNEIRESIASIVVCMGHLRGETGQQIERILSQIKQCIDIPREISTRVDSAVTSEVWLVQVGEISPNAKKRLLYQVKQEYKGSLAILDIEWLVDRFTRYYPEVFLGGEVLAFIEQRIQQLESMHTLSKKRKISTCLNGMLSPIFLQAEYQSN